MGATAERAFLTSLLALDADAPAAETLNVALRALLILTRARYGRAEIRVRGQVEPSVLATLNAPSLVPTGAVSGDLACPQPASTDLLSDVFETGFATARLELRSRHASVELTIRDRHYFELLFQALSRLARRTPLETTTTTTTLPTLHEATREFQARLVTNALDRARGNVARAARELRVTRALIYKFMRAAGARRA